MGRQQRRKVKRAGFCPAGATGPAMPSHPIVGLRERDIDAVIARADDIGPAIAVQDYGDSRITVVELRVGLR